MARRTVDEKTADAAVLAALRGRHGTVTRADLVVATALPEMAVERALERLLDERVSSVSVGAGGVLRYRFAPGLPRRREKRRVLRALLGTVARTLAAIVRTGRIVFRAVLAVQLLVYVFAILVPVSAVVGTLVGIGLFIMSLFTEGGGDLLSAVLGEPWIAAVVIAGFALYGIGWTFKKKWELLLELVGVRELDVQARGVDGLVARVSAFALGSAKPAPASERLDRTMVISRADEQRVLARVRAARGRLRAGDLVRWLGLGLDEADQQATRFFVEYGGEPIERDARLDETDVEVVEFRFPSLLPSAGAKVPGDKTRFERGEGPPPFTGNRPRHDAMVALFAGVNLVGGVVGLVLLGPLRGQAWYLWLAWLAGGVLPVFFSALLFLLPALRAPVHLVRVTRILTRLARARGVRAFVAHAEKNGDGPIDLEKLAAKIPDDPELPRLSPSELRAIALELGGEFDLDSEKDPGKTVWRFRRLAAELRD